MNTEQIMQRALFILLLANATAIICAAQEAPLGFFTGHVSVGEPALQGSAVYDPFSQTYALGGAGANMWFDRDEFHFLWRRMTGDFILRAHGRFIEDGGDPHRKLGLMIRSGFEADAAHVNAAVHGDGLTALQFRRSAGSDTEEQRSAVAGADVIQLERRGGAYFMSLARYGEPFVTQELSDLDLPETVYAGLFVCAHDPETLEEAVFHNVRIIVPPGPDYRPYQDFIGSNLEILDVETGRRKIVYNHPESIQAPNWTMDGRALIYNSGGKLYRFDLSGGTPAEIRTGEVAANNNDHVLSFDGSMLGISSYDSRLGGSVIYKVPSGGGEPVQVTDKAPSYLHGWSPDAQWLVYTAERGDGNYDIYKIPAEGGEEVRLTTAEGLDDGSEYSPDGDYIYFNSERTGSMELWRMRPDGSEQEQVSDDAFNNWFPHISPDGKSVVFLSYGHDVAPGDHPFYKHVYLRHMPAAGGEPKILAYIYGGQGTINVPSWSPDGRFVAFVSNSDLRP